MLVWLLKGTLIRDPNHYLVVFNTVILAII
jgi:hypothetical protein